MDEEMDHFPNISSSQSEPKKVLARDIRKMEKSELKQNIFYIPMFYTKY